MKTIASFSEIPEGALLYIFGAGRGGIVLRRALAGRRGKSLVAYIDNYKSGTIEGMPVISLDEFASRKETSAVVLVASQYYREIDQQLKREGVGNALNVHPLVIELIQRQARQRLLALVASAVATVGVIAWLLLS